MTKESYKCGKRMTASSRSLALEQAYVHDVYSVIAINTSLCSPVRSHVKEFLFEEFEMGSILLDVGCSDGKYLNLKSDIVIIGLERCCEWFFNDLIKYKTTFCGDKQQITGDVIYLPFRDELFDGVLCCGVLHHVSTVDRRIRALREITRILKIGGKLLLTVTSGPILGRELQSQDVLIKLDKFKHKLNTDLSSDETNSDSSTSSSSYSHSHYRNTIYESCNSPNSEFGSCYSFVRRALQRLSFTGGLHSRRTSLNKSRTSTSSSLSKEEFPIELRNIEDDESLNIESPIDNLDNKSINTSNTSHSNLINGSSLLSIIKEHIISFQFQFKSKHNLNNESNKRNGFLQRQLSQHRFSLPISFRRNDKSNTNSDIIYRNQRIDLQEFTTKLSSDQNRSNSEIKKDLEEKEDKNIKNREGFVKIVQKSFSSDSLESRQASLDTTGTRLVAYYSMPELHTLNESDSYEMPSKSNRMLKNKPKLLDLHPITFLVKSENISKTSDEYQTESILPTNNSQNESENIINICDNSKKVEQIEENENEIQLERDEMNDKLQSEEVIQTQCNNKFPKKLLRQRSFSADYQPEVPKAQNEQPRRFSASPNIGSTRVNQITHHQQISIDSEESFVTIIPANRSTRESVTDPVNSTDTFADFDQDYLTSSTDDDACCEEIAGEQTSEDDTSASSVTEVTKSTEKPESECQSSTPSPPTTLHRYFHVFRSGELEQLIEQNIQNLHVINSYYNERATSWCVVAEKVHVWTI